MLPSNSDLNEFEDSGVYSGYVPVINAPTTNIKPLILFVQKGSYNTIQVLLVDYRLFWRANNLGTWYDWKQL